MVKKFKTSVEIGGNEDQKRMKELAGIKDNQPTKSNDPSESEIHNFYFIYDNHDGVDAEDVRQIVLEFFVEISATSIEIILASTIFFKCNTDLESIIRKFRVRENLNKLSFTILETSQKFDLYGLRDASLKSNFNSSLKKAGLPEVELN